MLTESQALPKNKEQGRRERGNSGVMDLFVNLIMMVSWVYTNAKLIKLYTLNMCKFKWLWSETDLSSNPASSTFVFRVFRTIN